VAAPVSGPPRERRLLIVDDDKDVRELLADVLAEYGFAVAVASDGREALQILREAVNTGEPPRVVLLDLHMPVMNGREFRAHQKAEPALAAIPVITMSSDWDPRIEAHATLKKPLQLATLLASLQPFCDDRG